jgi:hypothetical protein
MRRMLVALFLTFGALLMLASTALASHLPAYPVGSSAACNQGTEHALATAPLWAPLYGVPVFEPTAAELGCHHHLPRTSP